MKLGKLSIFTFLFVFTVSPVYAQTIRSLQTQLDAVKEEVEALQRSAYRSSDSSINEASDVQLKIGQMDEIFRNTSGKIEELEYKIKSLEDKIEMINKDFDVRFKMLEEKSSVKPAPAVQAPAKVTDANIDELYQKGLDAIKAKDNQSAINVFTKILSDNPEHKLAGNAQYWLGETYYVQKDFQRAAVAFAKGYEKYKNGSKGADSLLKLGMSMVELKKKDEACVAFVNLPKEFPNADGALKSKALELAKKNSCK
ncbi:MAG: tol-pal system protein YbgF [Lactobacillaceae bacterium]|jgi:tol-pal system protein YbgF|nr:tol-pal system protein YbgF [Lactobacillaceae bacterium]